MSDTELKLNGRQVYRRLLGYAKPYWRVFVIAVLGMILFAATEPLFASLMKPLFDGSFGERNVEDVRRIPLLLIAVFLARGIAGFINTYFLRWVGQRVVANLRQEMFDHLLRAPKTYFDHSGSGQILAKLTYNVQAVADAATTALTTLVRDGFTVILLLGYLLYLDASLSMIFLVIGPVMFTAVALAAKRFRRYTKRIQDRVGLLTHAAQEIIDGHPVVKVFGGERYESRHFSHINEKTRDLSMRMVATEAISVPVVQFFTAAAIGVVVYLSSMQGVRGEISIGTFMSYVVGMALLLGPLKRLSNVNLHVQRGIVAADSLFELLDTPSENDCGTRVLDRISGRVELCDVGHVYDSRKGAALEGIDLVIESGETVAFVGRSGSGKSTLVSLLPRFYDCTTGCIRVDGVDVREATLRSLRRQISLVTQDVMLFNDTVANNIAYGQGDDVSRERLEAVAESAHALEFIQALPEGFDTRIGDRGVLLSGGQRQRLAIARAMFKDAPILILDEATSALDSESERHIQAALRELMEERTTLVIAHRLSTIEHADRIVVLQDGRIVEQGRHADLLKLDGAYAQLHRMQLHLGGGANA